jgi:hypothetical protein
MSKLKFHELQQELYEDLEAGRYECGNGMLNMYQSRHRVVDDDDCERSRRDVGGFGGDFSGQIEAELRADYEQLSESHLPEKRLSSDGDGC